jgi:hypothetical protein
VSLIDAETANSQTLPRRALAKVFGSDGFSVDIKLAAHELTELRRLTTESWLEIIRQAAPDSVERFRELGIENYHRLSHLLDHANLWTTHARTFDSAQAGIIDSFAIFDTLRHEFPEATIIGAMPPYGDLGRPRINWRLVRPGDGTDLGPIHADYWFDAVLYGWRAESRPKVKLKNLIPIFLE